MPKALKFLKEGGIGPYSGFQWPLPNGKPGKWVSVKGDLKMCERGVHACTPEQAMVWLQAEAYVIELGAVTDDGSKLVARKGRLVRKLDRWDEKNQRLFAADCAEHVLPIFEKERPGDDRPRKAIEAARAYARGEINAAAWDAAWDAAGAAAWDAARAAAWAAARAAAGAAAWDAAGAAEHRWQTRRLRKYLGLKPGELEKMS